MWRTNSLEKMLMLGKLNMGGEGDDRGWDGCMASLMWWTWVWVGSRSCWWAGKPGMLQSMGVTKSQTWLSDWTELNIHTEECSVHTCTSWCISTNSNLPMWPASRPRNRRSFLCSHSQPDSIPCSWYPAPGAARILISIPIDEFGLFYNFM